MPDTDRIGAKRVNELYRQGMLEGETADFPVSYAYASASGGADGVSTYLENFLAEFDLTMGLSGCDAVTSIDRGTVRHESTLDSRH